MRSNITAIRYNCNEIKYLSKIEVCKNVKGNTVIRKYVIRKKNGNIPQLYFKI